MYCREANCQQVVDDFIDERIFRIPRRHHLQIFDTNLYERQGKAISNFEKIVPNTQSDLAQEMTKEPYNFDFLTLRQNYDEKELKD